MDVSGGAERTRLLVAWAAAEIAAIVHRGALFLRHRGDLDALIAANHSWYTSQLLPREILRDHLLASLVMLDPRSRWTRELPTFSVLRTGPWRVPAHG